MPANIAVCTTAMTSPASGPSIVKPRMRSLCASTSAFIKPCVSAIVRVRSTALIGSVATRTSMPRRLGVAFVQADPGERRVREQAEGDEPVARGPVASRQVVADDPKIIEGDVGELGAAGALADRPDIGRGGLQAVVDVDVAARVHLDAGHFQANPCRVGRAPRRDQEVAAVEDLLAVQACARGG